MLVSDKPPVGLPENQSERLNIRSDIIPIEFVPVPSYRNNGYGERVFLYSVHGGDVLPESIYRQVRRAFPDRKTCSNEIERAYAIEKDWGANQVAENLSAELGTGGYWRVNIARVLMDFGRFPGITPPGADHLNRFAINYPFSYALDFRYKRLVLEKFYDHISEVFEAQTPGKVIKLGIHSYDFLNPSAHHMLPGTVRPELSLIFRSRSFQELKRMPTGLFDPLYPDMLAEYTADRKLTARISLHLEKAGVAVSTNFPYLLPDGSVEVRSQIWIFFKYVARIFKEEHPETKADPAYQLVWTMLLDTNLRCSESEGLRSYIHMYRNPPKGQRKLFRAAQHAYEHICGFFTKHKKGLIESYRFAPDRLSTLAVEVRKDLIWQFHDHHTWEPELGPDGARKENVAHLGNLIGEAIDIYMQRDRVTLPNSMLVTR
ncbi:MAG: hypothetical protein QNK37_10345 [Acidobacteriota bacterium]|nr:hypothetical protein [Acidobacteriota bacterium]